MDVVLGLDVGTSSTKVVAFGADGTLCGTTSARYALSVPAPGRAELDADALLQAARRALATGAVDARQRGDRVTGVAVSAAMHGLVPLDDRGRPLGPLVTWADARAAEAAVRLSRDGVADGLHARTGTPLHPMSPLVKLAHLSAEDPAAVSAPARWGGVKELVLAALLDGAPHVVDLSSAGASGLLDMRAGHWDAEALALAGVRPEQLGRLVPTTELVGDVVAEEVPPGTPLVAGATDGVLANLGSGAVTDGVAAVSLGTSGAVRAVRHEPGVDADRRLFCYSLVPDRWVLGGAISNAGSVVRWLSGVLEPRRGAENPNVVDASLVEEAAAVPPGARGLLCLPYLLGERAPWWRPGITGGYVGLRRDHGRAELVRAAVEGVCLQLALVLQDLRDAGVRVDVVRATGGPVASSLWSAVLAAALDAPVELADSPEGTGAGAALLGHVVLGALPDLDTAAALVPVTKRLEPDAAAAATYAEMRPLLERTVTSLTDVMASLARVGSAPAEGDDAPPSR